MADTELLEVGRLHKAHGLRGDVSMELYADLEVRRRPGARFSTDRGELVLVSARPHGTRWIAHFDGIDDRTAAETLRGVVLRAEPVDDDEVDFVHELIDSALVERDGTPRGRVVAVESNPAADLLVSDSGALVPMSFVVETSPGRVVIDPPAGLFDL